MPDYQVISVDEFSGVTTLSPPSNPKILSGTEALVQIVYLALMNSPGRSINYPDDGSGMTDRIGKTNIIEDGHSNTYSELNIAVAKVEKEIKSHQSTVSDIDPAEFLVGLEVLSIEEGATLGSIKIVLELLNGSDDRVKLTI